MEKVYAHMLSLIPNSVDFDFISVKTNSIRKIYLDNIADISVVFQIEYAEWIHKFIYIFFLFLTERAILNNKTTDF